MEGTALITGASSGIGAELARQFAANGHDVILVARSKDKLDALAAQVEAEFGTAAHVFAKDLFSDTAAAELHDEIGDAGLHVDILVNNAGMANFGPFLERGIDDLMPLVDLNVRALVRLTHMFLPAMVARGSGGVLNVASVAGLQPTPGFAIYGATKAFVVSLTESLSEELRGSGVRVVALCPGLVDTPLVDKVAEHSEAAQKVPRGMLLEASKVAEQGYAALQKNDVISVAGIAYQAVTSWMRYSPRWMARRAMGITNKVVKY